MSLIRNTFWNLSGYIIPTMVAIPALGVLARILGPEKLGVFTLAVAIVGYAGIFDAGLTRAVIREISIYKNNKTERKKIVATSSLLLVLLGLVGGGIIYFLGPKIVDVLNVQTSLYDETKESIGLISLALPFFLLNQVWLGVLEGKEQFKKINIIKSFTSSFIAGLPALFVFIHPSLIYAVTGLVTARFLSVIITFIACKKDIIPAGISYDKHTAKRLIKYGGWITVSNIISPLMAYFDRFIISHLMGASHVAYYTAPSEGVQRLSIFSGALSRAIFPKLSGLLSSKEKHKHKKTAYMLMAVTSGCIVLFGIIFSSKIMTLWMGSEFSGVSSVILSVLLIGFFFNSIAQIPFANIQAVGKSKVTAFIHMYELIPYCIALYFFIHIWGLIGAAIAWSLRVAVDCAVLLIVNYLIEKNENITKSTI